MPIVAPFNASNPGSYDVLAGEAYVDASYRVNHILADMDVRASVTNLFNNTDPVGMAINNGVFHPRGRNFAVHLSKRF